MSTISDNDKTLLSAFIQKRRALVLSLQESKGIKASGLSASLLRVEMFDNIGQLIDAAGYFEFEEFGRGPGGFPPFKAIYDWLSLRKYGLNWKDERERHSMAWAIMIKIRKAGTHTHISGRPTGVLSEAINEQLLQEFMSELATNKASEIKTDISRLNIS